ncbi:MAG: chromosomal replication initiator protein DnaA [Bacteroidaceae bacterium]|nr:chromosomal replication initiator protein DnaA [Bacteroidaceae bacterium]
MNTNPKELWDRCLEIIKDNISQEQYDSLFAYVTFKSYVNGELVLSVPSDFVKDYIDEKYASLMQKTLFRVFNCRVLLYWSVLKVQKPVTHVVEQAPDKPMVKNGDQERPHNVTPDMLMAPSVNDLDSRLQPLYNFNNYLEGDSNRLARSVGESIATNPAKTFNPFFVYGPSGCGKTHLVNAIGLRTKELHPEMRVLYLSAHLFQVQYTDAVRTNKVNDFIAFYQTIDMLIIDDIQELAGKTQTQNTFFHIFNHLHIMGKQIILTCDRPPMAIQGLEDRLLTRFKWGLQAEIEKPTQKLRFSILNAKVHKEGLMIPEEVLHFISEHIDESVRDLEGIINSLMAYSVVYNCDINMKLLQKIMPRFVDINEKKNEVSIECIKQKVCEYFNITQEVLDSRSRTQKTSYARQIAIYIASKYTGKSNVQIGLSIGGRNHATVIHSINLVKNLLEVSDDTRNDIRKIEELFA